MARAISNHPSITRSISALVFQWPHHHDDEEQMVFIPAAQPRHPPAVLQRCAQSYRIVQVEELGFQSYHSFSFPGAAGPEGRAASQTWMALEGEEVKRRVHGTRMNTGLARMESDNRLRLGRSPELWRGWERCS